MRIIVQDNFDDNNFDTNKWTEYEDSTATCTETNQRIELVTPVAGAHKGAGFYTNPLPIQGIYLLTAKFRCNSVAYSAGHRGIFIRRSADYVRQAAYQHPNSGIKLDTGAHTSGGDDKYAAIWYSERLDDGWDSPWPTLIDFAAVNPFAAETDHQIKVLFNGTTGKIEYWVDGVLQSDGIMSAAQLSFLVGGTGNKIEFEFYLSNYNEDRKHYYDDVRIVNLIANKPIFV